MKAPDVPLLHTVSRPTVHPDGSRAVVAVHRPDFAADDYVGQLWTVALQGKPTPRRLTRGHRDAAPRFSPDGRLIAFLRSLPGAPAQLHILDAAGGEPVQVTNAPLGVTDFRWRPDSTALGFTARVPEHGRYGTVPGIDAGSEPPRRITTLRYQSNGLGYTIDRRSHVFLVPVPDVGAEPTPASVPSAADAAAGGQAPDRTSPPGLPTARQVTAGDFDHTGLAFSPDGEKLLTVSARHEGRDRDLRSELVEILVDPAGAEPRLPERIVLGADANLSVAHATWAADGSIFLLAADVGSGGRDFVGRATSLYLLDGTGGAPVRLTDPESTDLDNTGTISVAGDGSALVQHRTHGRVHLLRVTRDRTVTAVTSSAAVVTGHDAVGESIVFAFQDALTAGDVALAESSRLRRLTDFSAPLRETGIAPAHELTVPGRDGYPVHGWVLKPAGPGPHPVLLSIHGGPFAQYTVALFDEAQVCVDAGYAVVMCNPRGSAGYGEDHGRAIRRRMGTLDQADVLDFLDGALADDTALDGGRLGIMGGSYGGFLTAWTIAHDHRFAASIVERGYLDPEAFVGTSDIGDFFSDEYTGTDPGVMRSQSPQAVVGQVRTPTLVLHSAQDLRCPLPQAERYYAALKRGGVPTELVIFPGEDHELSRAGSPRHRLSRFEIILDWWARYLPTKQNPPVVMSRE
jgi:dipeptidyl aminopeptidase/acylaminoacyl peptidase